MAPIRDLLSGQQSPKRIKQQQDSSPSVMAIDDDTADEVFSVLSSETARKILTIVYNRPRTASEIADEVDTSLQNVNYHITNLQESGLVVVAETWYSDQGKEMNVYAPADEALVLFAGEQLKQSSLLDAVKRLLGFVGVFAVASLLVDRVARQIASDTGPPTSGMGPDDPSAFVVPPGALFFAGCLVSLLILTIWHRYRTSY